MGSDPHGLTPSYSRDGAGRDRIGAQTNARKREEKTVMPRQLWRPAPFAHFRSLAGAARPLALAGALGLGAVSAGAQTYGIATMQPGTLNHTTGSAIAKVLKEKGGLNVQVQ